MKNKKNAFTFLEVIFALVVIGILAMIVIPTYRGYVKRGIVTEGKNLLSDVNSAQQSYRYRTGKYYSTTTAETMNAKLGVDFRKNKYFTSYTITANNTAGSFSVVTSYNGKSLTLTGYTTQQPVITDNFTGQHA